MRWKNRKTKNSTPTFLFLSLPLPKPHQTRTGRRVPPRRGRQAALHHADAVCKVGSSSTRSILFRSSLLSSFLDLDLSLDLSLDLFTSTPALSFSLQKTSASLLVETLPQHRAFDAKRPPPEFKRLQGVRGFDKFFLEFSFSYVFFFSPSSSSAHNSFPLPSLYNDKTNRSSANRPSRSSSASRPPSGSPPRSRRLPPGGGSQAARAPKKRREERGAKRGRSTAAGRGPTLSLTSRAWTGHLLRPRLPRRWRR